MDKEEEYKKQKESIVKNARKVIEIYEKYKKEEKKIKNKKWWKKVNFMSKQKVDDIFKIIAKGETERNIRNSKW